MQSRCPQLDAVRGIAVIAVIAFHMGWFAYGWLGVPVFFALSGYLITRQINAGLPALDFWRRRLTRITPLVFVYLVVNLAIGIAQGQDTTGYAWHFLFLSDQVIANGLAGQHGHIWHLWSIAVEMQAYLIWPLVAGRRLLLAVIGAVGAVYWAVADAPMTLAGSIGFFALGGLCAERSIPRFTVPSWLAMLGQAGFSIYIWQMLCISAASRIGYPALGLPLSVAIGFASWGIFERSGYVNIAGARVRAAWAREAVKLEPEKAV